MKPPYDQPTSTGRSRSIWSITAATSSAQSCGSPYCSTSSGLSDIPWPRLSTVTMRLFRARGPVTCRAQHSWLCDHPCKNRTGGPSGLPHSLTCSLRPPPPRTSRVRFGADSARRDSSRAPSAPVLSGSAPGQPPDRVASDPSSPPWARMPAAMAPPRFARGRRQVTTVRTLASRPHRGQHATARRVLAGCTQPISEKRETRASRRTQRRPPPVLPYPRRPAWRRCWKDGVRPCAR